ncbi:unnamed protein product, partial [Heterosigma akashiwo]
MANFCQTTDDQAKLDSMKAEFENMDGLGMPLDEQCFLRYLRAEKWVLQKAISKLHDTLRWRQEFGVQSINSDPDVMDEIRLENSTGKVYCRGFDKCGRVILYMCPARENSRNHDANLRHLVFQMERATAVLRRQDEGVDKTCFVVDYTGYSLTNSPPMRTSRASLDILQNHYPERLGACYMVNPPLIFRAFWNAIYPFIDPVTRKKFIFVKNPSLPKYQDLLSQNFDMDLLEERVGGTNTLPFNSEIFLGGGHDLEYDQILSL